MLSMLHHPAAHDRERGSGGSTPPAARRHAGRPPAAGPDPPRPPLDLGPDAATVTDEQFHAATAPGITPIKARLLDQRALAGIGNPLADENLWRAALHPARRVDDLRATERDRLLDATRETVRDAPRLGRVHTLTLISHRRPGGQCPHDGAPMSRGTVGGRTSWWCPMEQAPPTLSSSVSVHRNAHRPARRSAAGDTRTHRRTPAFIHHHEPTLDPSGTPPPSGEYYRLVKKLLRDRRLQSTSITGNDH